MNAEDRFVEIARIVKPVGIKGEIKVQPFTQHPQDLARYATFCLLKNGDILRNMRLQNIRVTSGFAVLKLQGIENREQAEQCRQQLLCVCREQLPQIAENEFFIRDLIGLSVFSEEGELLGTLTDVLELPAHDVYQVQMDQGELLIPAISEVICDVDFQRRAMTVRLLDGLRELA